MTQLFLYSLCVAFCLTLIYCAVSLSMRGLTQFRFRRVVVMASVLLSLALPMVMSYDWNVVEPTVADGTENVSVGRIVYVPVGEEELKATPLEIMAKYLPIAGWIYVAGLVAVAAYFAYGMILLRVVISRGVRYDEEDGRIVVIDKNHIAPFSWAGKIALSVNDLDDASLSDIITHEEAHVRLRHWVDMVVMCAVCALTWYFPTAWLIRHHLKELHEYEADNEVIASGTDVNDYRLTLIRKIAGRRYGVLASSINQSSLKKRFIMMTKSRVRGIARLRALALLPAIAIAVAVMMMPETAAAVQAVANPPEKIVVVDAPELNPEYPGGIPAMMDFLTRNVKYPKEAEKKGIQGKVVMEFVVTTTGDVADVKVLRGVNPLLDAEAVRVTKLLKGFKPGTLKGKPVNSRYVLPLQFRLPDNKGNK